MALHNRFTLLSNSSPEAEGNALVCGSRPLASGDIVVVTVLVEELVVTADAATDESGPALLELTVPHAATIEAKAAKSADLRRKITHTYPMDGLP